MKKSPWWLFLVTVLITSVVAFAVYATRVEACVPSPAKACHPQGWLKTAALWLKPNAAVTILVATLAQLVLSGVEKAIGGHGFRKTQVEKFLNEIVRAQFKGEQKNNRLTLFRTARGPKAWLIAWWRLRNQEDPDERRRKREVLKSIRWNGTYLYVYARASRALNKASPVVWRVYKNRDGSEGIAGKAWDEGEVVIVRDLPKIKPDSLGKVKDLTTASPDVQDYAKSANLTDIVHVRAMRTVAQHFMGVVIETNERWGVLLVDSVKGPCPFPLGSNEKPFKKQFRDHATMLSLLLS
jgi:hypothetical protein